MGDVAKHIYDPVGHGIEINAQRDGYPAALAQSEKLFAENRQPIFAADVSGKGALAFADVPRPDRTDDTPGWKMVGPLAVDVRSPFVTSSAHARLPRL